MSMTVGDRTSTWWRRRRFVATLAAGLLGVSGLGASAAGQPGSPRTATESGTASWVGTWAAVPTAVPPTGVTVFDDETIRQVVHTSVAGGRLRIRLTNELGEQPLRVGEVHVGTRAGTTGTDVDPASDRTVRFSGRRAITIPAGAPAVSDPVRLRMPALSDLVVSTYLPDPTPATTLNAFAFQENVVAEGNVTGAESVDPTATNTRWHFLSGVSVRAASRDAAAIVALGDSITNGANTEVNANHRYPDFLARRLNRSPGLRDRGVLNLGVAGNRLLHDPNPPAGNPAEGYAAFFGESALRRFDRDVLAQPGVRYVIVLLGVNDLGHPGTSAPLSETVTAGEIIAGHRQLIARAHVAGLRIYGGTILPFKGDTLGFYSRENERKRQRVNRWIRHGGEYDAVVDFDAAMRDPARPRRLRTAYDSGDHLHPNDLGMAAMARAVPLRLFR